MSNSIALMCAWGFKKSSNGTYHTIYTHWIYLDFISKHFDKVYIITTVRQDDNVKGSYLVDDFKNCEVVEIPYAKNMLTAQMRLFSYLKAISSVSKNSNLFYCRVPDPFSWMPKLLFRKKCIVHFVGDSIESAQVNPNWSKIKKFLMISAYVPDYLLTLLAAKKSATFCNGNQIAVKLAKRGIKVTPLISSTIIDEEIIPEIKTSSNSKVELVYTGFLRYWKGINTIIGLIKHLEKINFNYRFHIIGEGEMYDELNLFIIECGLKDKVLLYGHINDRARLNNIYRNSDIYIFPSLGGEGSPRSVIEAMAQGLLVISTPVGSLPTTFTDRFEILFAKYNDIESFLKLILEYSNDRESFNQIRNNALNKIRSNFTRDKFLTKIFLHEK